MAKHLQISHGVMFENKYNGMVQPTWQKTNHNIKLIKDAKRNSDNITTQESDYYNSADSIFPYKQEQTSSDYESFADDETNFENLMLAVSEETKTYSLIEQSTQPNSLVASTRFREDIIFSLENTKIFEVGVACLSTTIAASMFLLPEGFNTGTSLVLSAPLLVCICGILAKYAKHNS
ncbi:MAG: hypothetical protein OXC46_02230 [Thaumarchaeota archaeon]|nr:hypothetical protein [Nitrososphaerota archaeon]